MRAHEFLTEQSHQQDARNALITILTTNHALGITKITLEQLARSLEQENFFLDGETILDMVKEVPIVDQDRTTDSEIYVKSTELPSDRSAEPAADLDIDTTNSVEKMAKRALAKRSK